VKQCALLRQRRRAAQLAPRGDVTQADDEHTAERLRQPRGAVAH